MDQAQEKLEILIINQQHQKFLSLNEKAKAYQPQNQLFTEILRGFAPPRKFCEQKIYVEKETAVDSFSLRINHKTEKGRIDNYMLTIQQKLRGLMVNSQTVYSIVNDKQVLSFILCRQLSRTLGVSVKTRLFQSN